MTEGITDRTSGQVVPGASRSGPARGVWRRSADFALVVLDVMGRGLMMFALGVVQIPLIVIVLLCLLLTFGLGLVFLFPPAVRLTRRWTAVARRHAQQWSGIEIEDPYNPPPPPPVRQRDGWYHVGGNRYRSPRYPAWHGRLNWYMKDEATWRDMAWLLVYPITGALLAVLPWILLGFAVYLPTLGSPLGLVAAPLVAAAAVAVAPYVPNLYGLWTRALLGATMRARLTRQVARLARTRTETVDAQTAELHRIERDLHDGAQARLVAMGMTLGAAEQLVDTDPAAAKALLARTREASQEALAELRRLVRGIHPPVLAERGLGDAVRALALDSPLRVAVEVDLPDRPEPPVESAVYFAVSELLTNAARHADAHEVSIDISRRGTALRVTVTDDGVGGVDPSRGSGLRGLERRLAAFDGVLAIHSPVGGPTVATIELPNVLPATEPVKPSMSRGKTMLMGVCLGLAWLPLFPQGVVAVILKIIGIDEKSWFLALHLPDPFGWAACILFINIGLVMLITGLYLSACYESSKRPAPPDS
ncbi:histidine kinase [Thermopolyspora sp. NPDC052614]|uniref:sensor histidine kinase n=1 Tax=Thermopolyspora sp. NPDC052614 TaxID=3155682 RepID=UPI003416AE4C